MPSILITLGVLIVFLITGMPIALTLMAAGMVGLFFYGGQDTLIIGSKVLVDSMNDFILTAIPLFVLMGVILGRGDLGGRLFKAFDAWLRFIPGGLGIATLATCGVMAAMCGSTTAIGGSVSAAALPSLRQFGYKLPHSEGMIAAGGTLGILIPPSGAMIIIGALSGESVAKLFISGVIPGLLMLSIFIIYTSVQYRLSHTKADLAELMQPVTWKERWQATKDGFFILFLPVFVMVPLYVGWATPTEVAALGVLGALILVFLVYRSKSLRDIIPLLREGFTLSVIICFLIAGGLVFGAAMINEGLPFMMADFLREAGVSTWMFMGITIIIVLFMGCFITGAPMALILLPILLPSLQIYHIDIYWYAVVFVILNQIGGLTPPVGIDVFVVHGVSKNLGFPSNLTETFKGAIPYMICEAITAIIVILMPELATWLPSTM